MLTGVGASEIRDFVMRESYTWCMELKSPFIVFSLSRYFTALDLATPGEMTKILRHWIYVTLFDSLVSDAWSLQCDLAQLFSDSDSCSLERMSRNAAAGASAMAQRLRVCIDCPEVLG